MTHSGHETRACPVEMCFELEVILTCTSKKSTEKKMLSADNTLQTVLDVKHWIEKQFSVPICVQDFTYESQSFADTTTLKSLCLRSGDTVHVSYLSDASCAPIDEVATWLRQTIPCMQNETPSIHRGASVQLVTLMKTCLSQRLLESLTQIYFNSFGDARSTVNRLYFMQVDGINLLVELLTLIQRVPWAIQVGYIRFVELQCLQVLCSLCETRQFGDAVCKHGGLECCIKALLHKVVARDECLIDSDSAWSQRDECLLEGVMIAGLGALRNLSEVSESCRVILAANLPLLHQAVNISTITLPRNLPSVFMEMTAGHMAATMLLCISFTSQTHEFLTNCELIDGIVHVCQMDRPCSTVNAGDMIVMTWYQTCMFLTQLVLISWKKIAPLQRQMIFNFMQNCIQKFTWNDIMNIDARLGTTYETFLPYIRLFYAYYPENNLHSEEGLSSLRHVCLDVAITGLQATLGKLQNYMIVAKEGLLDYVTCIPFHVPSCLEAKARNMVAMVSASGKPPSLANMSKAKLAKMHLGLELVVSASAREITSRLL